MNLEECYAQLHGDYASAKARLTSDRLVEKFMLKYLSDPSMSALHSALAADDAPAAFTAAHTLKGVAGNLSFTELHEAASALTEQLRPLPNGADDALVVAVEEAHELVVSAISAYQAQ